MTNVYVEPRPKGRHEGDPIEDYVVEDHAGHVLGTSKRNTKLSPGRGRTGTRLMLLASGTSTTRNGQTTGEPLRTLRH